MKAFDSIRNVEQNSNFGIVRGNWLELEVSVPKRSWMSNPFRQFKMSPEIIRLAVMLYVRFPLSLRKALPEEIQTFCPHAKLVFCRH